MPPLAFSNNFFKLCPKELKFSTDKFLKAENVTLCVTKELLMQIVYINFLLRTNIFVKSIRMGVHWTPMQTPGLHINNLLTSNYGYKEIYFKSATLPPFGKGRWFFSEKKRRDWPWYNNLIFNRACNRTSYINKMFFNLSVSYRWQLSLPKRALLCGLFTSSFGYK